MLGYALWCVFLDMGESQQQVKQLGSQEAGWFHSAAAIRRSSSKETHFTAAQQVAASS